MCVCVYTHTYNKNENYYKQLHPGWLVSGLQVFVLGEIKKCQRGGTDTATPHSDFLLE